jgi:hypothetical protein
MAIRGADWRASWRGGAINRSRRATVIGFDISLWWGTEIPDVKNWSDASVFVRKSKKYGAGALPKSVSSLQFAINPANDALNRLSHILRFQPWVDGTNDSPKYLFYMLIKLDQGLQLVMPDFKHPLQ